MPAYSLTLHDKACGAIYLRMRWRQVPCVASLSLTCGRGAVAFLPTPQIARSAGGSSYRIATGVRTNTSRTLSSATRTCTSESLRRGCFQVRGGWGGGWGRRQSSKHDQSRTLKAQARDTDDVDAEIRGGALPRTTGQTSALGIFSGPIKLQVGQFACLCCSELADCELLCTWYLRCETRHL